MAIALPIEYADNEHTSPHEHNENATPPSQHIEHADNEHSSPQLNKTDNDPRDYQDHLFPVNSSTQEHSTPEAAAENQQDRVNLTPQEHSPEAAETAEAREGLAQLSLSTAPVPRYMVVYQAAMNQAAMRWRAPRPQTPVPVRPALPHAPQTPQMPALTKARIRPDGRILKLD